MYDLEDNDDFDREMIATYEEVAKLYPRVGTNRPIVLIGAPGVGRNELKRRLIARDPEKYRSPVPCKNVIDIFLIHSTITWFYCFWQTQHERFATVKLLVASIYLCHARKWKLT